MVLWWIANIVGLLVVIPLVIVLANRVIRQALEAARYADEILEHGVLLAGNLEPVPALVDTHEQVRRITAGARRYVAAVERLV
jgi:integral membrane sensor domain MASE1